ncbi:ATP-binding protein [Oceanicoccus sp. KOV_DT_Chl]|uniref:ATP-binding protein n=1 Tax=Oceanicoccus sp. KOV_DT_Chl TaxID=1904639 RepID=UPI000C7D4BEE|nr:ATP-binding protein [Oceanicoccus sp. KOV_DT_Chl]
MPKTTISLTASAANLRRLAIIRLILILGLLTAIGYIYLSLKADIIHPVYLTILAILSLLNILTFWRLQKPWPVTDLEYCAQILCDIAGITALLYVSGGATNPFVSYYLVPLSISAAVLPWRYTWAISGLSLAAYTALLFYYQPLPAFQPQQGVHAGHHSSGINLHILGMWMTFALSTALITYFVVKMANALRLQQQLQANNREDILRDEQILAVATLAAGTAHELGTPLATMTVLVDELIQESIKPEQLDADLLLLKNQLHNCKKILQGLVSTAEAHQPGHSSMIAVEEYIQNILDHWQVLRPQVSFSLHSSEIPLGSIQVDSTLEQAIVNLLNNAADANPDNIDVHISRQGQQVQITIRDHGSGIDLAIAEQMGKPFITTKGKGLGLGLFLTHATISRYGGSIKLFNHPEGGAQAELLLPLNSATLSNSENH